MCHQMPLKHLQLLSVFQADNVVWLDRSADGDGRLLLYFRRCWRTRKLRERGMHIMDKQRQIGDRNTVIRHMGRRSEEHTSELQSLMRITYAVFCLQKKTKTKHKGTNYTDTY